MDLLRKHRAKFKWVSLISLTSGTIWIMVQIRKTREILDNAIDTSIIDILEPPRHSSATHAEFTYPKYVEAPYNTEKDFSFMWNALKFVYARRLLNLTNNDNKAIRLRAIKQLANVKKLENWQYSLLASTCDATTSVGLARIKDANPRLFLQPTLKFYDYDQSMLVNEMKDYLIELDKQSNHSCLKKFISQAFVEESHKIIDQDLSSVELSKLINQANDILLLCVEALLHHTEVEEFSKQIVSNNGLSLLLEIYNRHKSSLVANIMFARIFSNISVYPDLLEDIHKSGWIGVLSKWLGHEDIRVSLPASCALTNLDPNSVYKFDKLIYRLHPVYRNKERVKADIVFVHGLLGGIFFTWRQRDNKNVAIGLMGKPKGNASISTDSLTEDFSCKCSDPATQEHFEMMKQHMEEKWDELGSDFEAICYDTPTFTNENAQGPFTHRCESADMDACPTKCWPKDWLAVDCPDLRIIGVNYETSISTWTAFCPHTHNKMTLDERSDQLMSQLLKAGVGDRPIVWITHSMGGLLVKNVLNKAWKSKDKHLLKLCHQTRGIVFYSTPHFGSKVATLNPASALILWPSVEVQELRQESPSLVKLHEDFLEIAEKVPMRVVSFVETSPTIFTALKLNFLLVEPFSGNPRIGEYYEIPQDHLGICKPANRYSFLYQKVVHLIKTVTAEDERERFTFNTKI